MREVALTNSNKVVLVDDEDYAKLINYKWNLGSDGRHPQAWFGDKTIEMHTLILPVKLGFFIDHKDRNGLNNQKENLR